MEKSNYFHVIEAHVQKVHRELEYQLMILKYQTNYFVYIVWTIYSMKSGKRPSKVSASCDLLNSRRNFTLYVKGVTENIFAFFQNNFFNFK